MDLSTTVSANFAGLNFCVFASWPGAANLDKYGCIERAREWASVGGEECYLFVQAE